MDFSLLVQNSYYEVDYKYPFSKNSPSVINPLGPRTTKVVNASRVMRTLAPLHTLLSPPRTLSKQHNFRSAFLENNILSTCRLNRTYSHVFRVNISNMVYCS